MRSSKSVVDSQNSSSTHSGDDATTVDGKIQRESPPPSSDSCPFDRGEKVLAYHNQQIYDAKVLKIEFRSPEWKFYVHYIGWKKNWDEWVGVDRLMKHTEENLQKQAELGKKLEAEKIPKLGRASQSKQKGSNGARGKKRKSDSVVKEEDTGHLEKLVHIPIPPLLKKQLLDDCDFVTHQGKLVELPRSPNVDDILKKYLDYSLKKGGMFSDSVEEILKGLRSYFDKALPVMLLYNREREQYQDAITEDVSPSTIYGAEHLLRLFVKLPELLFHANIEEETLSELQQKLHDFLRFLQKHQHAFFLSTYFLPRGLETSVKEQEA
ncbi:MRG domain [Dillenia turbinata]|uniref:MRG domain n=1 Tax=Dillenia turbinata TaxID=194707 RepID=A0AAN8VXR7_9MAGN